MKWLQDISTKHSIIRKKENNLKHYAKYGTLKEVQLLNMQRPPPPDFCIKRCKTKEYCNDAESYVTQMHSFVNTASQICGRNPVFDGLGPDGPANGPLEPVEQETIQVSSHSGFLSRIESLIMFQLARWPCPRPNVCVAVSAPAMPLRRVFGSSSNDTMCAQHADSRYMR